MGMGCVRSQESHVLGSCGTLFGSSLSDCCVHTFEEECHGSAEDHTQRCGTQPQAAVQSVAAAGMCS